jgi:hypothetical protein
MGLTAGDIDILGVNTDATQSMIFVALADILLITIFLPILAGMSTQSWELEKGQ